MLKAREPASVLFVFANEFEYGQFVVCNDVTRVREILSGIGGTTFYETEKGIAAELARK